mmetsp:Transcript_25202/g.59466  ORF Transcript_25202/g.59466 Transcript_25202/m.59466 type:complete len:308 (-) Transcript_25202:176-1099(-)
MTCSKDLGQRRHQLGCDVLCLVQVLGQKIVNDGRFLPDCRAAQEVDRFIKQVLKRLAVFCHDARLCREDRMWNVGLQDERRPARFEQRELDAREGVGLALERLREKLARRVEDVEVRKLARAISGDVLAHEVIALLGEDDKELHHRIPSRPNYDRAVELLIRQRCRSLIDNFSSIIKMPPGEGPLPRNARGHVQMNAQLAVAVKQRRQRPIQQLWEGWKRVSVPVKHLQIQRPVIVEELLDGLNEREIFCMHKRSPGCAPSTGERDFGFGPGPVFRVRDERQGVPANRLVDTRGVRSRGKKRDSSKK